MTQSSSPDGTPCDCDIGMCTHRANCRNTRAARVPKVRTSHHRNKEEADRLQALVADRYATDDHAADGGTGKAVETMKSRIGRQEDDDGRAVHAKQWERG